MFSRCFLYNLKHLLNELEKMLADLLLPFNH